MKTLEKIGRGLALTLMLGFVLTLSVSAQDMQQQPTFEEAAQLADMRAAGIRGDRSQIPAMIKALSPGLTQYHVRTALRALSELEATEALPAIDAVIARSKGASLAGFARVIKARIMAESDPAPQTVNKQTTRKTATSAQAENAIIAVDASGPEATLDRFLSLLSLDAAKMKYAVAKPTNKTAPTVALDPEATALYAPLEIADMALHNSPAYLTLVKVRELDYSHYPGAIMKMKIASMSHEERVKWLIDDLSKKKAITGTGKEEQEIQLAVDEGLPASHYAASVLKTMAKNQKDYPTAGFHALFMVLDGIWDETDHKVVATFAANADPEIRHSSGYYPHYKHQAATGF